MNSGIPESGMHQFIGAKVAINCDDPFLERINLLMPSGDKSPQSRTPDCANSLAHGRNEFRRSPLERANSLAQSGDKSPRSEDWNAPIHWCKSRNKLRQSKMWTAPIHRCHVEMNSGDPSFGSCQFIGTLFVEFVDKFVGS